MNSRNKLFSAIVLISGSILLLGAGCAKTSVSPVPAQKGADAPAVDTTVKEETAKPAEVKIMTDDLYVEIAAQMNYSLGKGELKYAGDEGFTDLLKEHGITIDDWTAFNNTLSTDTAHAASLGAKVVERLKELSK